MKPCAIQLRQHGWLLLPALGAAILLTPEHLVFPGITWAQELLFSLCLAGMARSVHRKFQKHQRQLDRVQYQYDVETLLFHAYGDWSRLSPALERVARTAGADCAFFWDVQEDLPRIWSGEEEKRGAAAPDQWSRCKGPLLAYFHQGHSHLAVFQKCDVEAVFGESQVLPFQQILAVPVTGADGNLCGILAVCGLPNRLADPMLLWDVRNSFATFCQNTRAYLSVKL